MGGAKGKKTHILFKEEDGSIILHVLDYYFVCLDFCFLLLFSKVVVLFSTGCSRAGIPPLSLRSLLGEFCMHFHIRFLGQASSYFIIVVSIGYCAVLQGAAVEGIGIPLYELVFHCREVSFTWGTCLERS